MRRETEMLFPSASVHCQITRNRGVRKMKKLKNEAARINHGSRKAVLTGWSRNTRLFFSLFIVHCSLFIVLVSCEQPNNPKDNPGGPQQATFSLSLAHDKGTSLEYVFPPRYPGYAEAGELELSVSNAGPGTARDIALSLSGEGAASFSLSRETIALIEPGAAASFTVKPKTGLGGGEYRASVTVKGPSGAAQSLGISFTVSVTPLYGVNLDVEGYSFPPKGVDYSAAPEPLTVTITNIGNEATGALSVALGGEHAAGFQASPASIGDLAPGATGAFTVQPLGGLGEGAYTATVTVRGGHDGLAADFPVEFRVFASLIEIYTAEELAAIADSPLDGVYRLMADLDLSEWTPLGDAENPFSGEFWGNNKAITIHSFKQEYIYGEYGKKYIGIFGYMAGAKAKDLRATLAMPHEQEMKAIYSSADWNGGGSDQYIGAIAGYAKNTELSGVTLSGTLKLKKTDRANLYLGGVVGEADTCLIENVVSDFELAGQMTHLNGRPYVGGLAGAANGTTIRDCRIAGKISGYADAGRPAVGGAVGDLSSWPSALVRVGVSATVEAFICRENNTGYASYTNSVYAGGLAGLAYRGSITECFSTGAVTSVSYATGGINGVYAGGIAGKISTNQEIKDCDSLGDITATGNLGSPISPGGIVGEMVNSTIERSYSAGAITAEARGVAGYGGVQSRLHAGGIAGVIDGMPLDTQYWGTGPNKIEGCAALNSEISWKGFTVDNVIVRRIANFSKNASGPAGNREYIEERYPENNHLTNNIGYADMVIDYQPNAAQLAKTPEITLIKGPNEKDGEDCDAKPAQSVYAALGWNFGAVWKMGGNGYPELNWQ
jgi:hypothetical protein